MTKIQKYGSTEPLGKGWDTIIELLYSTLEYIPFATIKSLERRLGMLSVVFDPLTNKEQSIILDAVSFKFERLSAIVCEHCGQHGFKRTVGLTERRVLCPSCYGLRFNDEHEHSLEG
jgi:hypothetical protein